MTGGRVVRLDVRGWGFVRLDTQAPEENAAFFRRPAVHGVDFFDLLGRRVRCQIEAGENSPVAVYVTPE